MAKQRYINTKFWEDAYVSNLDPSEKLIFLYLLTNSATSICGIYEIPVKRIASDTGYDRDMVLKILARFEKDQKIIYRDGWVVIANFLKHQNVNSPQVKKGIETELLSVPYHIQHLLYGIDTISHSNLNSDLDSNLNSNLKPEQDTVPAVAETPDEEAVSCTQFLYDKIKDRTNPPVWEKKPPSLDQWYKHIEQLHRIDGIKYDDIKKVIEWSTADAFWKNNILCAATLRKQFNKLYVKMNAPKNTNQKRGYDPSDSQQQAAMSRILGRSNVNR